MYIGKRPNSIISTYICNNGREIKNINFYKKETQEIIASCRGWLTKTNSYNSDIRLNGFYIKGDVKNYNANADIRKKMALGENFTVNVQKQYHFDDPACDLYIVIDEDNIRILEDEKQQELITHVSSGVSATTYFYRIVKIEVQGNTDTRTSITCKNNIGEREENTLEENKMLDDIYETAKSLGIYIEKADVGKILNKFNLIQREKSLQETIGERIQKEHSNEKFDKVINY